MLISASMIESKFLTELETRQMSDKEVVLLSPLRYQSAILDGIVEVPAGFKTDFASVPRVPIAYWFYGNRAHRESVIHDYIYSCGNVNRSMADKVFMEAMKVRNKNWFVRWPMFIGVRCGGWAAWKSHRNRDSS